MPKRFGNTFHPFHVSITHSQEKRSFAELTHLWNRLELSWIQSEAHRQMALHSLVLMGTHLHALVSWIDDSPPANIKTIISNTWSEGCEYFVESIESYPAYISTYRYIYRNPIHARIVRRAEDYPFSSLHFLLGKSAGAFPFVDNLNLISDPARILSWINGPSFERRPTSAVNRFFSSSSPKRA